MINYSQICADRVYSEIMFGVKKFGAADFLPKDKMLFNKHD